MHHVPFGPCHYRVTWTSAGGSIRSSSRDFGAVSPHERSAVRHVVALAGGIGGARFLRGLLIALNATNADASRHTAPVDVTVIGNTGDDITLFGLRICPDLDTVMYTLGGGINEEQGWGRTGETFAVKDELAAYAATPQWFGLGDRDIATHVLRTGWLADGVQLSEVTRRLCERWAPGVRLLPMSDDPVETHVLLDDPEVGERTVHFQEWWVRLHAAIPAKRIDAVGASTARARTRGARSDRGRRPHRVPAVQPGREHWHDPAGARHPVGVDRCARACRRRLPHHRRRACSRHGRCVSRRDRRRDDGARGRRALRTQLLDGWLVDDVDAASMQPPLDGIEVRSRPLLMVDLDATAAIARSVLDLAADLRA